MILGAGFMFIFIEVFEVGYMGLSVLSVEDGISGMIGIVGYYFFCWVY
jgi:hypothetical protein